MRKDEINNIVGKCSQKLSNVGANKTLEWIQIVRKQIDYKKPSNTEQINRVPDIWIEIWEYVKNRAKTLKLKL